jgi:hypothetical protein
MSTSSLRLTVLTMLLAVVGFATCLAAKERREIDPSGRPVVAGVR